MTPMFRSLSNRNYRLFASGQVVSLSGTWAQRVAQDWLVLTIVPKEQAAVALGITTALQFLPMLLFGLYGGVLADRYDKRQLLIGAQAAMGVLALILGLLDLTGSVELWHVYLLAFGLGLASVVDTPARQSFVSELVGTEDLPNAVSLNSATFNSARIVGPALAGLAIAGVGTGLVFIANALSYLAVLAGLLLMRPADFWPSHRQPRGRGQLREGVRHVRERPELYVPILLVFMIGTFGLNFQQTLALIAKQTFNTGAGSFGVLTSCFALGSLLGALASARRKGLPRSRTMLLAALAFGVLEVVDGLAPNFVVLCLLLIPTGFAVLIFTTTTNSLLQLACDPALRGRVMSIYVLVFLGGTPVGAPLVGLVAQTWGPRASLLIGGAVCVLSALAAAALLARKSPDVLSFSETLATRRRPPEPALPDQGRSRRGGRVRLHRDRSRVP